MKTALIIFLSLCCIAQAKNIKWNVLSLEVPNNWELKQRPMPSLGGYFLEAKTQKKLLRFFVHTNKPSIVATRRGSEKYFKDYISTLNKNGDFKCNSDHKNLSYQCLSYLKRGDKWSLNLMYWYKDKERIIINLEDIASKGEAQTIFNKIKVGLP